MTIWDDRILEILRDEGPMPVGEIEDYESVRLTQSSISRRCSKLADNGLLIPLGNGVYAITEVGEGYLDEDYDAENEVWMNNGDNGEPTAGEQPGET